MMFLVIRLWFKKQYELYSLYRQIRHLEYFKDYVHGKYRKHLGYLDKCVRNEYPSSFKLMELTLQRTDTRDRYHSELNEIVKQIDSLREKVAGLKYGKLREPSPTNVSGVDFNTSTVDRPETN